jgi:hypothetical protein
MAVNNCGSITRAAIDFSELKRGKIIKDTDGASGYGGNMKEINNKYDIPWGV